MRSKDWSRLLAGLTVAAPIPYVAHAETYLTESQAAAVLFPGVKLQPGFRDLSKDEIKSIEKSSHEKVRNSHVRVWRGPNRETLFIDQVLGKHEEITYAVAINPDATVKGIEIMDYRETYGYQVRQADWRKQFVGKSGKDPLKLDKDIRNISGATLSSAHITNGVRRILHTYEILAQKA
jgi:Na+-translocating ferredoxin:NAD+ oxidoreductase RnfG subunit